MKKMVLCYDKIDPQLLEQDIDEPCYVSILVEKGVPESVSKRLAILQVHIQRCYFEIGVIYAKTDRPTLVKVASMNEVKYILKDDYQSDPLPAHQKFSA